MPTVDDNASGATVEQTPPAAPVITDDLIKSHPLFQDLETKHAAARQGMDQANVQLKQLKKALVNEDEPEIPEPTPATTNDIQSMKEEIRWELKNERQIDLANKNGKFDSYVKEGKSKQDALKLALFDEGITNSASQAESMRQASASAPSAGIDRTNSESPIEGLPASYVDNLKAKGLTDKQIKTIVKAAKERAAKRG